MNGLIPHSASLKRVSKTFGLAALFLLGLYAVFMGVLRSPLLPFVHADAPPDCSVTGTCGGGGGSEGGCGDGGEDHGTSCGIDV